MAQSTVLTVVCLLMSLQCCFTGVQGNGGLGEECNSGNCNEAAHVCDTNRDPALCKIKPAVACTENNADQCVAGATCVSDTCTCTAPNAAAKGDLCDPVEKYVGGTCDASPNNCLDSNAGCQGASGAEKCVCSGSFVTNYTDYTCVAAEGTLGGACKTSVNTCDGELVCNNNFCKKKVGADCNANNECVTNGQCGDEGTGRCKCSANFVPKADNTTCLAAGDLKQPCKTGGSCNSGLVCNSNACKHKADQTCKDVSECPTNAACQDDASGSDKKCTCNEGFTKQASGLCSGAASVTASVLLLTLTVLVTSRLA